MTLESRAWDTHDFSVAEQAFKLSGERSPICELLGNLKGVQGKYHGSRDEKEIVTLKEA